MTYVLYLILAVFTIGIGISSIALGHANAAQILVTLLAMLCDLRILLIPFSIPVFYLFDIIVMLLAVYVYKSPLPLLDLIRILDVPLLSLIPWLTISCAVLNLSGR